MRVVLSFDHWRKPIPGCVHGPQTWPWWRLFGLGFCRLAVHDPSTGYRMWVYTRAGGRTVEVIFDRRFDEEMRKAMGLRRFSVFFS